VPEQLLAAQHSRALTSSLRPFTPGQDFRVSFGQMLENDAAL